MMESAEFDEKKRVLRVYFPDPREKVAGVPREFTGWEEFRIALSEEVEGDVMEDATFPDDGDDIVDGIMADFDIEEWFDGLSDADEDDDAEDADVEDEDEP